MYVCIHHNVTTCAGGAFLSKVKLLDPCAKTLSLRQVRSVVSLFICALHPLCSLCPPATYVITELTESQCMSACILYVET
jgi:hypothetical protein